MFYVSGMKKCLLDEDIEDLYFSSKISSGLQRLSSSTWPSSKKCQINIRVSKTSIEKLFLVGSHIYLMFYVSRLK